MAGTKSARTSAKDSKGFTAEERAAMKERSRELKAERTGKGDGESDVLAKIAAMGDTDRAMATRLHELVRATTPELMPRTYYGMPAYARDGKVVCFFQSAEKFKSRYAMLGFSDRANLDKGSMWPVYFALKQMGRAEEAAISALLKKALS